MSRTRDQLEAYLKALNLAGEKMLDVGGSQRPVSERLGGCNFKEVKIFDLSQPHETKVKPDYEGDINFRHGEISGFDTVVCLEVFDYVWDPVIAMLNLYNWTREGGKLIVSFPFVYPVHNPMKEDMLRYTEFGARKLIENAGFKVEDIFVRTADTGGIMDFYRSEGMRCARDYKNHNAVGFIFTCTK